MDIWHYSKVLWRFRLLVGGGILLALVLAVLAVAKPTGLSAGGPTLKYRQAEVWQANTELFVTQGGFPWGRSVFPPSVEGKPYPFGDEGRLANLTNLYSEFAGSDTVRAMVARRVKGNASISAAPVISPSGITTPLLSIFGTGNSPARAILVTKIGTQAFLKFLDDQQNGAGIPMAQRVKVTILKQASGAIVIQPRKKTLPIVVFLAVLSATVGLAFLLENMRPHARSLSTVAEASGVSETRRSA